MINMYTRVEHTFVQGSFKKEINSAEKQEMSLIIPFLAVFHKKLY